MTKLKLCFISDTHNKLNELISLIPKCDYLIHCGDSTNFGTIPELGKVNAEFEIIKNRGLVSQDIICIAGNHDFQLEKNTMTAKQIFNNAIYLENSGMTLSNGMYLYGSPMCPRFFNWAFMKERGDDIGRYWDAIPDETEILITHTPPYGTLDMSGQGVSCGCERLRDRIFQLPKLKVHAYGHIHESASKTEIQGIKFINASSVGMSSDYMNMPITIEI